jgi:hypothetical protein
MTGDDWALASRCPCGASFWIAALAEWVYRSKNTTSGRQLGLANRCPDCDAELGVDENEKGELRTWYVSRKTT